MRTDEITVDLLTQFRTNCMQSYERLRRGRSIFPNNVWHIAGFPVTGSASATTVVAIDQLTAMPFIAGPSFPLRAIAFNITAIGGAGSVARVGIYAADEARIYPTSLIVDSGSVDTTVASFKNIAIAGISLDVGKLYFFVYTCGVAAPTVQVVQFPAPSFGWPDTFGGVPGCGWNVARAFGALPAAFPAGAAMTTTIPMVGVMGA